MNKSILRIFDNLDLKIPLDLTNGDFSFSSNPIKFSQVLSYISNELNYFYNFGTVITPINDDSEKMSLYLEICGLLREIGCPYVSLLDGPLDERFSSEESINLLLNFFLSELAAAKIIAREYPDSSCLAKGNLDINDQDTNLTSIMKPSFIALGVGRPPDNMSTDLFFSKLELSVKNKLAQLPKYFLGKSLLSPGKFVTNQQWAHVDILINALNDDYNLRRETAIQRLDVTIRSFLWSPKATKDMNSITSKYTSLRSKLASKNPVTLIDLLAARDYPYTIIYRASSGDSREASKCKLNKFLIGPVPDRGGRTSEMEAPPPEMPAFQKRDATQPNQGKVGFQNQNQVDRGGSQNQSVRGRSQNQSGRGRNSYDGGNSRMNIDNTNYVSKENPSRFSQSVASNNLYSQGTTFVPQYQSQGHANWNPQYYDNRNEYEQDPRYQDPRYVSFDTSQRYVDRQSNEYSQDYQYNQAPYRQNSNNRRRGRS